MSKDVLQSVFTFSGFDQLMPYRIRDILLVSSLYDSFVIEQDGRLTELLLSEYAHLNLSYAPLVTRVSSGEQALQRLDEQRFDLIITMTRLGDMEVKEFGERAKEIVPEIPVVCLVYNTREINLLGEQDLKPGIDRVFAWRGDSRILLAIIKCIEDQMNAAADTFEGSVRCILLVENSVRFYSSYLPLIYTELMRQTQNLMADGIDVMDKLLRMRARPKILLAETYEEALTLYQSYKDYMLCMITDAGFDRGGVLDPRAGVELIRHVKREDPDLPVLMQSSEAGRAREANALGVGFLHKGAPTLLKDLRRFIKNNLGFGDFIFQLPNGTEVARAGDLASMNRLLKNVPVDSIHYHARRNHFSNWFMARTEFELAMRLRPVKVHEFEDPEELRAFLRKTLKEYRELMRRGRVADFSRQHFDTASSFVRIGDGSLGGKGRGLAFMDVLLTRYDFRERFPDIRVFVPESAVLATGVFDQFLDENDLLDRALGDVTDEELTDLFTRARLPVGVMDDLVAFLDEVRYPLAVRSSSLLEDSQHQPFAGVYMSHMLANNNEDDELRLEQLCHAVKLVYASTYFRSAKAYLRGTPNRIEEEKMAVIIQRMVGDVYEDLLYPGVAGVAQSYNFYPVYGEKPEEGSASVVLGLGKSVVEGGRSLWFSPAYPQRLPQFSCTDDTLKFSQREFWALDLQRPEVFASSDGNAGLVLQDLARAEADGALAAVASTYMPDNDAVYDGISRPGVRLITMAGLLKTGIFPLPGLLEDILELGSRGMAAPVEIEFAANPRAKPDRPAEFAILQIRPMVVGREAIDLEERITDPQQVLIYSEAVLGNGAVEDLYDIIYVRPDTFDRGYTPDVALEIRHINERLQRENRHYLLVGPGRWGSRDRWLGIPVDWSDINWSRMIVETQMEDIAVEPSQGSHFFHNLTSFEVGYFTAHEGKAASKVDWDWLLAQPHEEETGYLRHVRLVEPLRVYLDGRDGKGVVLRP
jgi:CheY-like chemotaxis protein